jgi:hypothetical protein
MRILTGTILQLSNEDAASGSGDWFDRMATLRYTTASAIAQMVTAAMRDVTDVMRLRWRTSSIGQTRS